MATKAGTHDVAGDRNCCASCSASAAVPEHAGVNLPGIATVVRYRDLPALDCHGDKLGVGLHLGPTGWMEWRTAEQDARRLPVPSDSLSLVPAGISYWWRRDQPSELVLVELESSFVAGVARNTDAPVLRAMPVFQDRAIAHILSALREEIRDGCRSGHRYGTALCTALVIHLLRRYAAAPVPSQDQDRKGGLPPSRLRRVLDHIERHLGDGVTLGDLASLSGLSPDHFAAQFRRSTGLPPHRYVLQRRVGRAKELVAAGRLSLAEIGYALGFPSQTHFTTTFRKLAGTTPGAYRSAYSPPGNRIVAESRNLPLERERPAALIAATIGGTALNRTLSAT